MTHICYVIWKFSSPNKFTKMGGAENQLLKTLTHVKGNKIKYTIITRKIPDATQNEMIGYNKKILRLFTTTIPLLSMILFMINLFFTIIKLNKENRISIIHVPLPDVFIVVLFILQKTLKIPIITRVAGDELAPFRKHGFWLVNRLIVRSFMLRLNAIQALNPQAYKVAENLNYPRERLFLINNGTTIPKKFRQYDDIKNSIVYIGAMRFSPRKNKVEQKNLIYLINAFYDLLLKKPEMKLILVGDGNYRSFLENHVRNLGITENVEFVGYQTDILKYLLNADIFVNPSRFEGMPNTVIEAMASGVFVLCSNIPEHRFIIEQKVNGILFDNNNKEAFVTEVLNFYYDLNQSKKIASNGRKYAIENFSIGNIIHSIFNMYRTVIDQSLKNTKEFD